MGPAPTLAAGEYILWRGKPKKSAYIADKSLSLLPIAVIWLVVDMQVLRQGFTNASSILFLLLHLLPVWLWLGNTVTSVLQWRNEDYYLTNKRIIIRKGIFKPTRESVFLREIRSCYVHYGLLDRIFGSGDIYINHTVQRHGRHTQTSGWYLMNLADPGELQVRIENQALEAVPVNRDEFEF